MEQNEERIVPIRTEININKNPLRIDENVEIIFIFDFVE
jgi:hypothetical protein